MSCSWDRSLEKGMKSTMLSRALDLRDPATGNRQCFIFQNQNESHFEFFLRFQSFMYLVLSADNLGPHLSEWHFLFSLFWQKCG